MGNRTYIAAPVVGLSEEQRNQRGRVADRALDVFHGTVHMPWILKIPNAWNMPMNEWARCVFTQDLLELDCADIVVVCDYGRRSTAGTAWEAGYAFAKGKSVLVVQMPGVDEVSLMVRNGCTAVISYDEFIERPFSWPDYKKCTGIMQN